MISRGWFAAMAAAVALAAIGVSVGEPGAVLRHAASVCLACLGLG